MKLNASVLGLVQESFSYHPFNVLNVFIHGMRTHEFTDYSVNYSKTYNQTVINSYYNGISIVLVGKEITFV